MPSLTLRDYQRECVSAVFDAVDAGARRPAVILPTGAGKTVVFSEVARAWLLSRRTRVLVLAHREELIEQAAAKLKMMLEGTGLRVGIVKASRNGTLADVIVASVQTLRTESRRAQLRDVGLVIVDECHHATADTYRKILDHFGCFEAGAVALGFTATMSRGDKARLGDIWPEIVYERDIAWMISQGYLCGVDGRRIVVPDLDLARVKRMAGDYSEAALGAALEGSLAPQAIARAYAEHAPGRQGILFAPTVSSADVIGQAIAEQAGERTALVHGAMELGARRRALDDFRAGRARVLASCMILTEGTDLPMAEVGVMARPTTVAALYVQMAGRVLRPHPGKTRALLLDVCGVTAKHSLIAPVDLFGKELAELDREPEEPCFNCGRQRGGHEEHCPFYVEPVGLDESAGGADDQVLLDGPLHAVDVDLFHGSKSAWLRTYAGYWFLPAGKERFIAIVPSEDWTGYDVVQMHKWKTGAASWVARGVPELAYAQAYAEGNVTAAEKTVASKGSSWRARRASDKTHEYAARRGLMLDPDIRGGEASDLIARHEASARIDPIQLARLAQAGMQFERVGV